MSSKYYKYSFQKKVEAFERKHRKEELEYLRRWINHLIDFLDEERAERLKRFFPQSIDEMSRKQLMNIGGLVEKTLGSDPLYLKAVEASFENIKVDKLGERINSDK